ncbi:hypothetical protein GDO78_000186 [Eleutherodactylus coqui]|uniref:Uncharacterized protein n=1 Tax=Eleutherodactylus coqui TaxID=57060 RepID=A0A8J6KGP2_ELECQ|nr:hypothetical protein GDO78_000186 [Eleutherodactylus coqui]
MQCFVQLVSLFKLSRYRIRCLVIEVGLCLLFGTVYINMLPKSLKSHKKGNRTLHPSIHPTVQYGAFSVLLDDGAIRRCQPSPFH